MRYGSSCGVRDCGSKKTLFALEQARADIPRRRQRWRSWQAGLNELSAALTSFDATRSRGARSRPSRKKEKDDGKQATSKSRPTRSAVGAPKSSGSGGQERQRVGGSAGGSSAGSFGSEQNDEDGRR
ncbi:hypothetical protein HFO98_34160 [Rhizobium leguminosarum]|nr:hypothetical protein [Rhizobium leguminosarum]